MWRGKPSIAGWKGSERFRYQCFRPAVIKYRTGWYSELQMLAPMRLRLYSWNRLAEHWRKWHMDLSIVLQQGHRRRSSSWTGAWLYLRYPRGSWLCINFMWVACREGLSFLKWYPKTLRSISSQTWLDQLFVSWRWQAAKMVALNLMSNGFIVLACQPYAMNWDRALLGLFMWDACFRFQSSSFSTTRGQKIGIYVQASCEREIRIRRQRILMPLYPHRCKLPTQFSKQCSDERKKIGVKRHGSELGASPTEPIYAANCRFPVTVLPKRRTMFESPESW